MNHESFNTMTTSAAVDEESGQAKEGAVNVLSNKHRRMSAVSAENGHRKARRGCCRCGPLCACITLIVLIGLGILAYFLWPRLPVIATNGPQIDPNNGFKLTGSTLTMGFVVNVSIYSPNYIDYTVSDVGVLAHIKALDGTIIKEPEIAGSSGRVTFKGHTNTTVTIPFLATYAINGTSTSLLQVISNACKAGGAPIKVAYSVSVYSSVLQTFGFVPTYDSTFTQSCPSGASSILTSLGLKS
jgi:hypothetical protein